MRQRWLLVLVIAMLAAACDRGADEPTSDAPNSGLRYLGGEPADGFARATTPREFVFPADHGSHPNYRTEWWYFTGNLATTDARHFGFELTFFRLALAANAPPTDGASAWRADQVWMAHFAITDTAGRRFIARERLTREALGLAGASTEPLHVFVRDWSASGIANADTLTLRLEARDDAIALSLNLSATVPPIPQGDKGLDQKGAAAGNASYYYSVPRLNAEGTITVEDDTFAVAGLAWLDREWSTSALESGTVGWEWFALHLSDGSNLMFYRLRTTDGGASPFSGGTLVTAAGERIRLGASDVTLTPRAYWTSGTTAVTYPVAWRLAAPTVGVALEITPYLDDQELDLSVRYWEGAVHAEGRGPGGPLTAQGYLELAGY